MISELFGYISGEAFCLSTVNRFRDEFRFGSRAFSVVIRFCGVRMP